jgi:predicted RNase H-like nuclease
MRSVLGGDAAWTQNQPSDVALIADDGSGWALVQATSSYAAFLNVQKDAATIIRHRGSTPDPSSLLAAASAKIGAPVDLVAVEMPLSMTPIVGRRASDNAISSMYGARHASTHTPSAARPGKLSDEFRVGFEAAGYSLAVSEIHQQALLEVYPPRDRMYPSARICGGKVEMSAGLQIRNVTLGGSSAI